MEGRRRRVRPCPPSHTHTHTRTHTHTHTHTHTQRHTHTHTHTHTQRETEGGLTFSVVVLGRHHILIPQDLLGGVEGQVVELLQLGPSTLVVRHQQLLENLPIDELRRGRLSRHQVQVGSYFMQRRLTISKPMEMQIENACIL